MSGGPPSCPYCGQALRLGDGQREGFWWCALCCLGVSQQQAVAPSRARPAGKVLKGPWPAT